MNTLNRLTLPGLACLVSLSISPLATAKPKSVGYVVGKLAPELQMVRAQGGTLSLSSLKGRYVVLDLSTMWCFPSELAAAGVRDAVSRLNANA
ncbi:MAG TPA: redoxin domain-containing protein, partial [Polyangiaceae bacterium]|nr:redoxin domain-containing protein [Polyangiaceae bacterium]